MKRIVIIIAVLTLIACGSTTKTHVIKERDTQALDELVTSKSFEIESQWAQPQVTNAMTQLASAGLLQPGSNAGNINLIGNYNYLIMKGEKVRAHLPYYGERQMGGANTTNAGIEFDGIPQDFEVTKGKRDSYEITFTIADKNSVSENYTVMIQLFPNLSSAININSSHRHPIRYKGRAKTVEKDESKI